MQDWDFGFAENGLTAYRLGQQLESESFISWLGEEKFKELANFCLHYIADLDIPKKRYDLSSFPEALTTDILRVSGTFIEYRNGMINVSPIGRNCRYALSCVSLSRCEACSSYEERLEFNAYDNEHHIREKFVDALRQKFPDSGLAFAIGGQISFDVFPIGWDKTYCLQRVEKEGFEKIHFFGDKTYKVRRSFSASRMLSPLIIYFVGWK